MKRKLLSFVILLAAAMFLVGCGKKTKAPSHNHVDANKDCICDTCGAVMDTHKANPENNCRCDTCGFNFHTDFDYKSEHIHNSVCDQCKKDFTKQATDYSYVNPETCTHVDKDDNCVCDLCFTGMGHHYGNDGRCTNCGLKKRVEGNYTYETSFSTSPTNWNPHVYETADDGDVADLIMSGLYGFYFDGLRDGYEIWPEMASAYPEDVTEQVKAMEGKNFGIPADATEHYAYKIRLNKNAKWEDGTPIKAYDWVESFKLLMDPELKNYRAADQMSGNVVVANCRNYYYQGTTEYGDNTLGDYLEVADLVKGEDGQYKTEDGKKVYLGIDFALDWLGGATLKYYTEAAPSYFGGLDGFATLVAAMDENGLVPLTDENLALFIPVINTEAWGETEADVPNYLVIATEYAADYSFDNVGMFVDPTDEYAFYMVLQKPAFGFYYIYGMSSWLVKVDAYKAGISTDEITGVKTTNYNTSIETTHSYGPYMLSEYQLDKVVDFTRNNNWFGYSDSRYDNMYQTSAITQTKVTESSTRKEMFLKGELITYGLQAADYSTYGNSDYLYTSPGTTLFFMILAANESVLEKIQTEGINKTIICNDNFRHAMSLAFNKSEFSKAISPQRTPAFSVIGAYDIWNPTTGEKYRDTEIAKKAVVEFFGYVYNETTGKYSITGSDKEYTLDEANDAINGYSPAVAKEYFNKAYDEWTEAGKLKDGDKVVITYASSESSDFITKMLAELNRQLARTLEGTKLEGKVEFEESAPLGDDWSTKLKNSEAQTCLAGWRGGMLDPFGSMLYYLEPNHSPYAKNWWKTESETLTLTLPVGAEGADVEITTTLAKWSLMLTGDTQNINGVDYNFGYAQVSDDVRLTILAEFEKVILGTDYYIPFMQDASGFLLSKKVNYALGREDYNAVLGRGGMAYMSYNYNDAEWAAYVAAQGGTLTY